MMREDLSRREWMVRVVAAAGALTTASAETWRPEFLNERQNATLVSLGERIIPGSAAANCNRVIDLVLAIESEHNKQSFIAALSGFEKVRFTGLEPAEQDKILSRVSQPGADLHAQFALLKEWIADAFWSSQEGMRELGWQGRIAWKEFDGCEHPENRQRAPSGH
ncbi:MAG TPA: gluconate 2-dehydrogenase subunit 3 family protein [Bryobacteraceae bacterium]|jgi:hypothetical protein